MGSALANLRGAAAQRWLQRHQRQRHLHHPLPDPDAARIALDTGFSKATVHRLHCRFHQLCRRGNEKEPLPDADAAAAAAAAAPLQPRLLSRRQMMSDPELSLNPLGARIVCALYPRGRDAIAFPEFCSAIAVFRPARTPAGREAKLQFVYRMLDIEENDFLSLGELCSLLHMLVGNNLPLEQIQSIACRALSEVDQARDNRISYTEFLAAMEGLDIEEKMAIQF